MSKTPDLREIRNPRFRAFLKQAIYKAEHHGDTRDLEWAANLKTFPVDIREFIESPKYMDAKGVIYESLFAELEECNNGQYQEAVFTGAIGTGKTTLALYSIAYQLYIISCMKSPHKPFGLDPATEIEFIFQSISGALAKDVDFDRFKAMIENSPYFQTKFMFDKNILSQMKFPNRIIVKPVSGSELGSIGQNVIGGVIDELNFMAVIEGSKKADDTGTYDQAVELYNSIARRRKSRFMVQGRMPGLLCLVSSKRFPGQFTDRKFDEMQEELATTGETSIFYYDKRVWDIRPDKFRRSQWFNIFIGDITRKPFIIESKKQLEGIAKQDEHLIDTIPEEYRTDFKQDILKALRDIAGKSTMATAPFILNVEAVADSFRDFESIFSRESCDFAGIGLGIVKRAIKDPELPRFAHVDLGLTSDAAGIAIGCVPRFEVMEFDDAVVHMPIIRIDGTLRVTPPPNGEINFEKIRNIFYSLTSLGMNLRWITFDSYQSVDSIQILATKGYQTGNQSVDKTTVPYDVMKTAILDHRLQQPENERLQMEILRLERTLKGKIDHPPNFSKDISDALAGVVFGLTMQRFIWASHGVQPNPALVDVMRGVSQKEEAA